MPIIKCDIQTLVSHDHHCHYYVACGPPAHCGAHAFLLPNLLPPTSPLLELVQFCFPPGSEDITGLPSAELVSYQLWCRKSPSG